MPPVVPLNHSENDYPLPLTKNRFEVDLNPLEYMFKF
jgi:hypothetical protein